jgi:uncharacterized protein (DUF58 family)
MLSKFLEIFSRKTSHSENKNSNSSEQQDSELREAGKNPLSEIARKVKRLEIATKKKSDVLLSGQYRSRFRGQGMQFADVRVYQYGDDVRHIDWRSSARSQQTYVKTFEEERELNILFAVDVSASNNFGSGDSTKRDTLALAIASIAFSAASNRDMIGLVLFSDEIERYIPPQKGRKQALRILEAILDHKPKSTGTDLQSVLRSLPGMLNHSSVVFVASDFNANFQKMQMQRLSAKHDMIALFVTDPRELTIPNVGLIRVRDPETNELLLADTSSSDFRKRYSQAQARMLEEKEKELQSSGVSIVRLSTDRDPAEDLGAFFQTRTRK